MKIIFKLEESSMLGFMLDNTRNHSPLIHNITNYVTVNDCANILLACGASPIMADDIAEVEEITSICSGLVLNIGTLNERTVKSMFAAGKKANELSHPVTLDPVGAGASALRTKTALKLMDEIKFDVIRGNISEIKTLFNGGGATKGVDAAQEDKVGDDGIDSIVNMAKEFSAKTGAIIIITGEIDVVSDEENAFVIRNGHPMMSAITGSGCMLSAMTTAFVAANPEDKLKAAAASVCAMGLAGQLAFENLRRYGGGNSSYRNYLIDEIYLLNADKLNIGAKYELR